MTSLDNGVRDGEVPFAVDYTLHKSDIGQTNTLDNVTQQVLKCVTAVTPGAQEGV